MLPEKIEGQSGMQGKEDDEGSEEEAKDHGLLPEPSARIEKIFSAAVSRVLGNTKNLPMCCCCTVVKRCWR